MKFTKFRRHRKFFLLAFNKNSRFNRISLFNKHRDVVGKFSPTKMPSHFLSLSHLKNSSHSLPCSFSQVGLQSKLVSAARFIKMKYRKKMRILKIDRGQKVLQQLARIGFSLFAVHYNRAASTVMYKILHSFWYFCDRLCEL